MTAQKKMTKQAGGSKLPSDARLDDNLATPFKTEILGVEVTGERVDMNDDEQIVAVCARGKSRQRVTILDLPLPTPPPEGADWIIAFRHWARGGR